MCNSSLISRGFFFFKKRKVRELEIGYIWGKSIRMYVIHFNYKQLFSATSASGENFDNFIMKMIVANFEMLFCLKRYFFQLIPQNK